MVCRHANSGVGVIEGFFKVPVIAVFTKYDQFRREMHLKIEDENRHEALFHAEVERIFYEEYLAWITMPKPFVRTESETCVNQITCTSLISVLQKCTSMANGVLNSLK
jgi:hypothetical protein